MLLKIRNDNKWIKKILNNNNIDIDENEKNYKFLNIKYRLNKINNLIKNLKKN